MVGIWFGLFFIFRFTHLESKLSEKEQEIYLITVLLYPLVHVTLKKGRNLIFCRLGSQCVAEVPSVVAPGV